jgi:hypothetical protein
MGPRRVAIVVLVATVAFTGTGCRFSRNNNAASPTSSSASTVDTLGDETSTTFGDETTTTTSPTSTSSRVATTARQTVKATTRTTARPASAAKPGAPHCTASAADTFVRSTWTVTVSSTFPNTTVVIDMHYSGGSGNYSGITDASGGFSKTQTATAGWRGHVDVSVSVGSAHCSTSFNVS